MSKTSSGLADSLLNSSFIALVFSVGGWALLEAWLLMVHANGRVHAVAAVPASILVFLSLKHFSRFHRRPFDNGGRSPYQRRRISGAGVWNAFFLFAAGGLIGLVVLRGDMLLLAALFIPLSFVPWSRIPFCRNHFVAAGTTILVGAALALFIGRQGIAPMFLPIASWLLWTCASFVLVMRAEKLRRNRRSSQSMASPSEPRFLPD